MKSKHIIGLILASVASSGAHAQLQESMAVEGKYVPLIIDTERLSIFPQGYKFELPAVGIDYDLEGKITDFQPSLLSMGATGRLTDWPGAKPRGFIDFRMGSRLNTRLIAGYAIVSDSLNVLNVGLRYDMSTLFRMRGVPENYTRPTRRRLYDGRIGLDYYRLVGPAGLLNASAGYRLAYFNYYGTTVPKDILLPGADRVAIPTQTLNEADARISFSSDTSVIRGWHAEASVDYLGYRRLYSPAAEGLSTSGGRETILGLEGGYNFNFADNSAIAVDAHGDFIFMAKPAEGVDFMNLNHKRRHYGVVGLRPSYRLAKDALMIRAGLDLAVGYKAQGYDPDDAKFYVAPDVEIAYRLPAGVGLFVTAAGGVVPSTLKFREEFDRYQLPYTLWNEPVYTPVDARIGVNAGPFAGFTGSFAFRYAVARNVPLGGWYQQYLGAWPPVDGKFTGCPLANPDMQTVNLSGFGFELGLDYSYGSRVELAFRGGYVAQSGEDGIFNGFDRPRWTLDASAAFRPASRLKVEVGYEYRGVRNCYVWGPRPQPGLAPELLAWRLPDITNLKARVTFSLLPNFDIYCNAENLLNRHVDLLPGLQSEGLLLQGGFQWIIN